jgi:hypothetical protein
MGVIPAPIGKLTANYPRRDAKKPDVYQYVDKVMKGIPGTPCCVQMSHALNMAGVRIPARSYRRANAKLTINGTVYYYILATDELEKYLISLCGDDGEEINLDDTDSTRSEREIKNYISNRPGIIIFRYSDIGVIPPKGQFEHTEIWDGTKVLQRDMAETFLFGRPRVLMWDTNDPASWLTDYMATQP